MTPEQKAQLASVRVRWQLLSGLSPAAKVVALRAEGWAHAAIQQVAKEKKEPSSE